MRTITNVTSSKIQLVLQDSARPDRIGITVIIPANATYEITDVQYENTEPDLTDMVNAGLIVVGAYVADAVLDAFADLENSDVASIARRALSVARV